MEQIKIDVVKQWLINQKAFSPLEVIEALEKENAELKKDKEWLDNINNEQTKIILELQEQIEKMKNCANCKHCDCKTKKEIKICGKCTFDKLLWSQWELAK